jgi:thiol-disulfide isomerase/thioredoxin
MDQHTTLAAARPAARSRRWVLGSLVAVAAGAAVTLGLAPSALAEKDTESLKGKAAPEIALKSLEGGDVKLSELKGKVVLVDFWATWCGPCVKSLPHINEIAGKKEWQEKGLAVWAVNLREQPEKIKAFLTAKNLTVTVPLDSQGKTAAAYEVQGIPTTVVIGRDGKVAEVFVGAGPDTAKMLDEAVEKALKKK